MSARDEFPKARLPNSHYFVTFARGENARCYAIRPWALVSIGAIFPLCALIYLASAMIYILRDDMLTALMHRQSSMQLAYEDRIANMRMQLDRVTSGQLLDQNSLEARMHDLLSRQARIESRSAVVASLAESAGITAENGAPPAKAASIANPLLPPAELALPAGALSFAPTGRTAPQGVPSLPRPGPVEVQSSDNPAQSRVLRSSSLRDPAADKIASDPALPPEVRIGALARSLERIETGQIRSVNLIATHARRNETRLRQAIAATGLSADKLQPPVVSSAAAKPAMGGPFVPFKMDANGTPFEREVVQMQDHVLAADKLWRIANILPLSKPLTGDPEITSGFGSRPDPFNGRLASHTGIDFKQSWGAAVRATAAGTIVFAGPNGGYGNMVDVDHGNDVVSRYAHLSAVSVKTGQAVSSGMIVGRLGSTGRSTGPHLHYEVRHHDHPLDPRRFLAAGLKLSSR